MTSAFVSLAKRLARYLAVALLGLVLGFLGHQLYQLRAGPPLQPWHAERLNDEFTAKRAGEIRSFDDYRKLEDRLFAQLKEQVYGRVGTGPDFALLRYSAGSAADPLARTPNWNRSFELPAENPAGGVLLLHGLTDSPYTFRALAQALARQNYWVLGLRLPGHGTAPSGLLTATWEDMAAAVARAMDHLESVVGPAPLHLVGYSTGAPLALDHVLGLPEDARRPASLVLVSPAIGVTPAAALAKWKARLARLPGLGKLAWTDVLPEFDPYKYNSFTANAGYQVHRITEGLAGRIEELAADGPIETLPPTLVFLSTVDATVSTSAVVERLLRHLAPERHELVLFDINREAVRSNVLIDDPGPLTGEVMADATLPFAVTLIANLNSGSRQVVARRKPPLSAATAAEAPLNLAWPPGVISLSHVALPFPPDDPLYGQRPPGNEDLLFLGEMAIKGERNLLKLPGEWSLRLRHNPFYGYLEERVFQWLHANGPNRGAP